MSDHPITLVEFCAGYGGLGLGLERVLGDRLHLIGLCELEGFAQANLISKMEAGLMAQVPIWPDLRTFPYGKFRGLVDIAAAGIPCQPHSHAGKRKGGSDERFLFDDWLTGLEQMRPRFIFIENVEGLLTSKMPDGSLCIAWTVERLEGMGYRVEAGIFDAATEGAPHQRKRVFILAYRVDGGRWQDWIGRSVEPIRGPAQDNSSSPAQSGASELAHREIAGLEGYDRLLAGRGESRREPQESQGQAGWCDSCRDVWPSRPGELDNAAVAGQQAWCFESVQCGAGFVVRGGFEAWPSRPGEQQHGWEPPRVVGNAASERPQERTQGRINCPIQATECGIEGDGQAEPPLGRDAYGPACRLDYAELCVSSDNRTDELRLLGNGVVPATAERAWRVLYGKLMDQSTEKEERT